MAKHVCLHRSRTASQPLQISISYHYCSQPPVFTRLLCKLFKLTQSIWMTDWGCPSYFLPCLFVMRKTLNPAVSLLEAVINLREDKTVKAAWEKIQKKEAKNQWDGNKFWNLFHFVFKEFFIWRKLTKSTGSPLYPIRINWGGNCITWSHKFI